MKEIFKKTEVPLKVFDSKVDEIFEKMQDILKKKNKMYGGASMSLGDVGVFVHIYDKVSRLKSLITKSFNSEDSEVFFEGIEDTYRDIIGYSTIGLIIFESMKNEEKTGGQLLNEYVKRTQGTSFAEAYDQSVGEND